MQIAWRLKKFEALNPFELYEAIRLRNEVFVVEQNCVFQDADNFDQHCYHLLGYRQQTLVAYSRLVPPGVIYKEASIGRVVSSPEARRSGAGRELVQESITRVEDLFGKGPVRIGAQLYLKKFYGSFGFEQVSDVYLEDGIEHIYMLRNIDPDQKP